MLSSFNLLALSEQIVIFSQKIWFHIAREFCLEEKHFILLCAARMKDNVLNADLLLTAKTLTLFFFILLSPKKGPNSWKDQILFPGLTILNEPSDIRKRIFRHVRPTKIQISLCIRAVYAESSLSAFWTAKDAKFLHADNENFNQTARMRRLIGVFVGRTC